MERAKHQEKLGWISGIAAFGFCVFLLQTPDHVDITNNSQICFHTPHTNKKEEEPLLFPFFVQLRSLCSFLLSRKVKEVKIRENFVILVLKINSSTFKVEFLSLAVECLFSEKSWELLELQTYQPTSHALPGWAVAKAASGSEFYVVGFFLMFCDHQNLLQQRFNIGF